MKLTEEQKDLQRMALQRKAVYHWEQARWASYYYLFEAKTPEHKERLLRRAQGHRTEALRWAAKSDRYNKQTCPSTSQPVGSQPAPNPSGSQPASS